MVNNFLFVLLFFFLLSIRWTRRIFILFSYCISISIKFLARYRNSTKPFFDIIFIFEANLRKIVAVNEILVWNSYKLQVSHLKCTYHYPHETFRKNSIVLWMNILWMQFVCNKLSTWIFDGNIQNTCKNTFATMQGLMKYEII